MESRMQQGVWNTTTAITQTEFPTSKSVLHSYMCRSKGASSDNSGVNTHKSPSFIQCLCVYTWFSVPVFYSIFGMASSSLVVSAASKVSTPLRFLPWASFYLGIWLGFDKITKWRVELAGPSLDAWQVFCSSVGLYIFFYPRGASLRATRFWPIFSFHK